MVMGLKILVTSVSIYAGVRLSGIAIEWLRETFDRMRPPKR